MIQLVYNSFIYIYIYHVINDIITDINTTTTTNVLSFKITTLLTASLP